MMAPLKKLASMYVVTLLLAVAAILAVLQIGLTLPPPSLMTAAAGHVIEGAAATESSVSGLTKNLSSNFNHPLSHLLVQLVVVIALSHLVGRVFKRFGQPAVVGQIVTGIMLGPSLLGLLAPDLVAFVFPSESLSALRLMSQVGVCLFMFVVGMELDVRQVRSNSHVAIAVSHVSIAFPYVLGVVLAYFLFTELAGPGTNFVAFALFMGISMSITAFPVLARILQERGISRTVLGTTAMTCAAVDDVTAWTILAFVVAIASATSVGSAFLGMLLVLAFIATMMFGVRLLLPKVLGADSMAAEEPSHGALAIVVCMVMAASLTTEVIGIHALFGAFLAGSIMPDIHGFRRKIGARIEPLSSVLLLPLFFAFTGLRTQIGLLQDVEGWSICLLITAVATLGKLGGSAAAARYTGMKWIESLQLGALMNTRGLMELIALNIGYDLGILSPRIFTMLVIMAVLTTMLTGPLLTLLQRKQYQVAADLPEPERRSHAT
jgi:Kef-type K+ transport system membrane component KefB